MNGRWPGIGIARSASALWTPLDEPTLFIWVDCRDPLKRNITNDRVSQVEGQNNASIIFANGNATRQPIVKADGGIGFEPSVNAGLSTALRNEFTPAYTGPLMTFIGADLADNAQAPRGLSVASGMRGTILTQSAYVAHTMFGVNSNPPGGTNVNEMAMTGTPAGIAVISRLSGVDQTLALDTWIGAPGNFPTLCGVISQVTVSWASDWHNEICSDAMDGRPFRGSLYDVVLLKSPADSLALAQRLEGWAMHRYGRANELPAGHLYKNAPPTK